MSSIASVSRWCHRPLATLPIKLHVSVGWVCLSWCHRPFSTLCSALLYSCLIKYLMQVSVLGKSVKSSLWVNTDGDKPLLKHFVVREPGTSNPLVDLHSTLINLLGGWACLSGYEYTLQSAAINKRRSVFRLSKERFSQTNRRSYKRRSPLTSRRVALQELPRSDGGRPHVRMLQNYCSPTHWLRMMMTRALVIWASPHSHQCHSKSDCRLLASSCQYAYAAGCKPELSLLASYLIIVVIRCS